MTEQGQFERLMADIEKTIKNSEDTWWMDESTLCILVTDGQRSEFDAWRYFQSDGIGGVVVYDSDGLGDDCRYDCIVTPGGLERMARMADLTIAARAWLAKEKGCMVKLKQAVRSLAD